MELLTARFAGHQSFPFRNTWLTKGDPVLFGEEIDPGDVTQLMAVRHSMAPVNQLPHGKSE